MSVKRDHLETTVSMCSGAIINYLLTLWLFGVSYSFALGTSVIFFVCSYLRCYIIRRIFRKTEKKEVEKVIPHADSTFHEGWVKLEYKGERK